MKPVVLGVAGGTGSGKTTVARAVLDAVGRNRIAFLAQDSYYKAIDWNQESDPRRYNFDHPRALDHGLLLEHMKALRAGVAVETPVYDFVSHRRKEETQRVEPRPVVLLEGILLFVDPKLRQLLDFKIFVDTDADIRLIRRLRRDIADRGRKLEDVLEQYETTVRPMHLEFVEPSKRYADVIIPEGGENTVALGMVVARVEQLLVRAPAQR
jgi:uridine kinase